MIPVPPPPPTPGAGPSQLTSPSPSSRQGHPEAAKMLVLAQRRGEEHVTWEQLRLIKVTLGLPSVCFYLRVNIQGCRKPLYM